MNSICRNLLIVSLAGFLLSGCGRRTELPALAATENALAQTAAPAPQYTADDSVCRWSETIDNLAYAGIGVELAAPLESLADAVVRELTGGSPAFRPDGEMVATVVTGEAGDEVHVWRAENGRPVFVLPGDAFVFSPDNRSIAVHQAQTWALWDIASREERYRLQDAGRLLSFSADGRTIVAENSLRGIRLYAAGLGTHRLELPDMEFPTVISPNGELLAALRPLDVGLGSIDAIVLWDVTNGTELHVLQPEIQTKIPLAGVRGHQTVRSLAFSPDGKTLLSAGPDALRLWDVASGEHMRCFQTPEHSGASQAVWGADAATIIGGSDDEIYLWAAAANHPYGTLGHSGPSAVPSAGLSFDVEGNSLVAWSPRNPDDWEDTDKHNIYLWDIRARRLLGVLPASSPETAVLSPTEDRAVTVSVDYGPDGAPQQETLLWDTTHGTIALAAAAQTSYWDALAAAARGEAASTQLRHLRKAQSLSPELFADVESLDEDAQAWYAAFLERTESLEAVGGGSEEVAEAFHAEITDVTPQWFEWSDAKLVSQVANYILLWDRDDVATLLAAYQEFAELDPEIARSGGVIEVLLDVIAPDALALAHQGDLAGATALLREQLASYPDFAIDGDAALQSIYAQELVYEGESLAQVGDLAGAVARYEQALALDPFLAIEPEAEAKRIYAQELVYEGESLAQAGDLAGAVTRYEQALALDPSLEIEPEAEARRIYAQALVYEGNGLAQAGDLAGAVTRYDQALALDSSLAIEPETEARRIYAQALVDEADELAWTDDFAAAAAQFAEALTFDPSLGESLPHYVQAFCVLRPERVVVEDFDTLCAGADMNVSPIAPGETVTGSLPRGDIAFWSFDAPVPIDVTLELRTGGEEYYYLSFYLYGPDGFTIGERGDLAGGGASLAAALPQAGHYLVGVSDDYLHMADGAYQLTLSATETEP